MLMLILGLLGYLHAPASVTLLTAGLIVTALVCASLGMLIAVYSKSYEDFAVIMNFFIFPTFFLSGALYPVQQLPLVLKSVALANPFSYGVDLIKHALLPGVSGPLISDFSATLDLGVMLAFIAVALGIACFRFSQTPVIETFARVLNKPRPR
jgi:ABC-2 type transport system permease protein